jgi:hypothetical protein
MSFSVAAFAVGGAVAAAGPIIIHLLHRRRFRTVDWAAMQFLRQAVRQSRRILHLRDLLLLILRTAAVLLFGFAMARPFFSSGPASFGAGDPVHAVVLVDNSLSMAYRSTSGTLLDDAKEKCRRFVEALPPGSRAAILPVCSDPSEYSLDPTVNKQTALEALDAIRPVDRRAAADAAIELAKQALRRLPDLPNKRVVFVGDAQKINFSADGLAKRAAELGDVQIAVVRPDVLDNAWVAELRCEDGVAVGAAPAEFTAVLRYEGPSRRSGVQVALAVDGVLVESRAVDLEPNARQLVSFNYTFPKSETSEAVRFADVAVSLNEDRLPADDVRHLVVPIVEPLAVVYVTDQGPASDQPEAAAGRGLWIQRLLAPVVERGDAAPKLVRITHVAPSALDATLVQAARLIILAGLRTPGDKVPLLREYVERGGQLLIAAGDDFDPAAWHDLAWRDGAGILPCPLAAKVVSYVNADPPKALHFDPATLGHRYFRLEEAADDELADLYAAPAFFAVVAAEPKPEAIERLKATETARIVKQRDDRAAAAKLPAGQAMPVVPPPLRLSWVEPPADRDHERPPAELVERGLPVVVGRYDDGLPFLVERRIDRGTVVLCTTGLQSEWNTLALSRAVIVLDRLARDLLGRTLPKRNFDTTEPVLIPTGPTGSGTYFQLVRPGDRREPLVVDALGDDKYALVLRNLADRGVYHIAARTAEAGTGDAVAERTLWKLVLAVAGPEAESHLAPIAREEGMGKTEVKDVRWVADGLELDVAGATVRGQYLWKWLMTAVLCCLLGELALLKWMRPAAAAGTAGVPARLDEANVKGHAPRAGEDARDPGETTR